MYPFDLRGCGSRGGGSGGSGGATVCWRPLLVAGWRVSQVHLHVVRHFFQKVGRNQTSLAIHLALSEAVRERKNWVIESANQVSLFTSSELIERTVETSSEPQVQDWRRDSCKIIACGFLLGPENSKTHVIESIFVNVTVYSEDVTSTEGQLGLSSDSEFSGSY